MVPHHDDVSQSKEAQLMSSRSKLTAFKEKPWLKLYEEPSMIEMKDEMKRKKEEDLKRNTRAESKT